MGTVCVLATGYDVNLLKFDLYVDDKRVEVGGLNFFKGMMMGGVPNYFHPVGVWHSAWTHGAETLTRLAIRIIRYMDQQGLRTVRIEPKEVDGAPRIMPNYVKRAMSRMPRLYGNAIDNAGRRAHLVCSRTTSPWPLTRFPGGNWRWPSPR